MGSEYGCCCYAEVVTVWGKMLEECIYATVISRGLGERASFMGLLLNETS